MRRIPAGLRRAHLHRRVQRHPLGAGRAAPCRYLKDLIEIFEAHGWDWSYHAFREWNGWSVEHGPDRNDNRPAAEPTDRERLLREWFAMNQKPQW
ncbi:MAG: hypothetical protein M0C28_39625 [Candidatus Moduliflexus flocculans]|nr:hypothetical protein [Candidatus Moduliflexus flocculans]